MVFLSGSIDPGATLIYSLAILLGLLGGFLAWLIGSAGRSGKLGFGISLLIGTAAGALVVVPAFGIGIALEKPLAGIGLKSIANWSIVGLLLIIILSTCIVLLANAWYSRKRGRAGD